MCVDKIRFARHAVVFEAFFASQHKVASSKACSNSFTKLSKTPQQFLGGVVAPLRSAPTLSNSYINTAYALYNSLSAINQYVNSAECDANSERLIGSCVDFIICVG